MSVVLVAGVVAVVAAVGFGVWRVVQLVPGAPVAKVEAGVQPPHPFELRFVTTAPRGYRLAVRLRRLGHATGGGTAGGSAPAIGRYRVTVAGRLLVDDVVGFGGVSPHRVNRTITVGFLSRQTRYDSRYETVATHVLAEIPTCPAGTEIAASGTFEPEPGVELPQIDVFLGR